MTQASVEERAKTPRMVVAVEACTSKAPQKLAECIIAAKSHAQFKACRDVE